MKFSRAAVIFNPNSGRPRERRSAVDQLVQLMEAEGASAIPMPTEGPDHATELARKAVADGCDLVIAHGGDGTMNEALQPLVGTDVTLCFWPGGTANVLAKELSFPGKPRGVVERIKAGRTERVTAGKANDRYFLLMAGIGLDASVAAGVDPVLKRKLGKVAFAIAGIRFLLNWNLEPVRVELPGEVLEGRFVIAGNARSYGGGFQLTPKADLFDPNLDICVFSSASRLAYLAYGLSSMAGAHLRLPGVQYRKVREAVVTGLNGGGPPVQLDGEVTSRVPVRLAAVPEAVSLLM